MADIKKIAGVYTNESIDGLRTLREDISLTHVVDTLLLKGIITLEDLKKA